MDPLERMFRQLVATIRTRHPEYMNHSFEVAELHQTILPYRYHRQALGLDTNEDYEATLLELLSGARGYLAVEDRMRDRLSKVVASRNPDAASLREFATARVALSPDAVRRLDEASLGTAPALGPAPGATPHHTANEAARCRYCDAPLPTGRAVTFCPHCGQNVTIVGCPACGAELEAGWRFCTACGRPTGSGSTAGRAP